jgi:protein gp37
VELIESKLLEPLRWKKPRRVFVNSMSDLFHENLPDESIDRVFVSMLLTPHITYQVLTKRARRLREYWRDAAAVRSRWAAALLDARVFPGDPRRACLTVPRSGGYSRAGLSAAIFKGWRSLQLPNVWLGVSIEDQITAAARIWDLFETPAAVRFVSYEPALGSVNLRGWLPHVYAGGLLGDGVKVMPGLDWVIAGGESGPGARPADRIWFRDVQKQCAAAGVPFFFKQWGGVRKGAGALLDGVEYKEFPRPKLRGQWVDENVEGWVSA